MRQNSFNQFLRPFKITPLPSLSPHVITQKSHRPQSSFRNCYFCLCSFLFFFFVAISQDAMQHLILCSLIISILIVPHSHLIWWRSFIHTYTTMLLLCCLKICSSLLMVADWKIASPYTQKIVLSMAEREEKKIQKNEKKSFLLSYHLNVTCLCYRQCLLCAIVVPIFFNAFFKH